MQVRVQEDESQIGNCGCGRSPTGKCIGWHGLNEQAFQHAKAMWIEEQFRKDQEAQDND